MAWVALLLCNFVVSYRVIIFKGFITTIILPPKPKIVALYETIKYLKI